MAKTKDETKVCRTYKL